MTVSELIRRLESADPEVVDAAIQELGRQRARAAAPALLDLLRTSDDATIRNAAALALSDMAVPDLLGVVAGLLDDPRTAHSRGTLLYALGTDDYDCRPLLPRLVELAITGGWEVRVSAAGLISQIEGEMDADVFDRAHERLRTAHAADPANEVLGPLLELFEE
ncbi:HEAT repeat domain-containing protein [Actinoplanes sp. L3-i22]|uniref:HEAT repeat domain-containing protein n=1 Tax=Actinoplanes sp. L3-i22 TaxID=2836373 RepID=UPI001C75D30B|nr:HEAT repeat domain-containing protein [Actinoplanes sp. L3-i22]BCY10250.1 hypothetical protein L3i22_053380 [Actinoplanes sp. L3-i22]